MTQRTPYETNDSMEPEEPEMDAPVRPSGTADSEAGYADGRDDAEASVDPAEEMARLKDQMLRSLAESENARRRLQKDLEDTRKFAVSNFAKEMVSIADNFRRALEAAPAEAAQTEAMKNLLTGVEAIERQMLGAFERFGIAKLEPLGQTFDPHLHRVMMEQEGTGKPPGTVVQVFQPGYMIHDRLLREALVVVAKGEPVQGMRVDTIV